MSSLQWVILYLCVAALVAGGAVAFSAWSRGSQRPRPGVTLGPALLAGAVWPLLLVGFAQWLLVHALGTMMRTQRDRTSEVRYYGPPTRSSAHVA